MTKSAENRTYRVTYSVTYKVPGAPQAGHGLRKGGPGVRKWAQIPASITASITASPRSEKFHWFLDGLGVRDDLGDMSSALAREHG